MRGEELQQDNGKNETPAAAGEGADREPREPFTVRSAVFLVLRLALLCVGMFVMAMGVADVTVAHLGTTPISTLPLVVSVIFGITFGMGTFFVNCFFVLGQIILLRREYKIINLLQIPLVFVFGAFIDIGMHIFSSLNPDELWEQWAMSLSGNFLLALGVWTSIKSRTLVQPGEGIVMAVSIVTHKAFSTLKICNDVSLVILAALLGWFVLGRFEGIGLGTLVSAIMVGLFIKLINALYRLFKPKKAIRVLFKRDMRKNR